MASSNPLLALWTGPHGGVPPFDRVRAEHFEPAFEVAMEEKRRAVAAIVADPAPPTFASTIEKLESAGRTFARVVALYGVWTSTMSTPEMRAVERTMAPRLAAFVDETLQNRALFGRVDAVASADDRSLSPEAKRLVWRTHTSFVRAGARLDDATKAELSAINQRLAVLTTTFSQNVLADEERPALVVEAEADLDGVSDDAKQSAAAAARRYGHEGKWVIENTRSAIEPFLTYARRADLRERAFKAFVMRGGNGDEHDNAAVITEILALRRKRANLLGYPTHAHWRLEDSMAKTPEGALALMKRVWPRAVARVAEEVRDMTAIAGAPIRPWDYRHYAEQVRKAKYDLDEGELKPYLVLDAMREGMFWVAERLFGFVFTETKDVPVAHPDVRVWVVRDKDTTRERGLWFFDPYARAGKQSGAWMSAYRKQERLAGDVTPIVSNNANVLRPGDPSQPTLLGWTDAVTLFHEFGHAIHGLASDVTYPRLAGTNVARDFVELPSQLFEHWLPTPEVLERFARHHATGEPMPAALVEKIQKASTFNQGFGTVEYLAAAILDMELHLAEAVPDPEAFERDTLARLGMPASIVMRHRTPHFAHVFSDEAYAAGYYSYLWADALVADTFEAFLEGAGPYDADVAARLRKTILSVGDTVDAAAAYRAFRGRDVDVDALLRKRGLQASETA